MNSRLKNILRDYKEDIRTGRFVPFVRTCLTKEVDPSQIISTLYDSKYIETEPQEYFNTILLDYLMEKDPVCSLEYVIMESPYKDFVLLDKLTFLNQAIEPLNIQVYYFKDLDDYCIFNSDRITLDEVMSGYSINDYKLVDKKLSKI